MAEFLQLETRVDAAHAGRRLDQALAAIWPDYSRSRLTEWIRGGQIRLDGRQVKPNLKVAGGETVTLAAELVPHADPAPQAIALDVLYEDEQILVINKQRGLVVHPGSGNRDGTLVNALLHHDPALAPLPRAGLVHRLDKDTTGCLLIARTLKAHHFLVRALKSRRVGRQYQALVWGHMISGGTVDAPIGRHPVDRRRQVVTASGRPAVTHFRVARHLNGATLADVSLDTGRTHQIRVHMNHIGFPLIGDPAYGRRGAPPGLDDGQRAAWMAFDRQALHAARLTFPHPDDADTTVAAEAPLPGDMQSLIERLSP